MKMCADHWTGCQTAIETRGLSHRISQNDEELKKRIENELKGIEDKYDYDPLAQLCFAIYSQSLKAGGLYLLGGDYCPLCELKEKTGVDPNEWINGAADAIFEHC